MRANVRARNMMTVQYGISKRGVLDKVSTDSQKKKHPPEMAQRIAMRLKGTAGGNGDHAGANGQSMKDQSMKDQSMKDQSMKDQSMKDQGAAPGAGRARTSKAAEAQAASAPGGGHGGNGPPDLQ